MRIGLLICTYNRPEYLKRCLDSIKRAELPKKTLICIVDDNSSDDETKSLLGSFMMNEVGVSVIYKRERKGIADSVKEGCDFLFQNGCSIVTNLDGDAIVRNDFMDVLLSLKRKWPSNIVTGFNCLTKNKDGSHRHLVIRCEDGCNLKKTVGGLNLMFDRGHYNDFILPALNRAIESRGNWDFFATSAASAAWFPIVCAVPSVVQHIGIKSSMGHDLGGEPPDVADDFKKLYLPDVTLAGADCVNVDRLVRAANICCKDIEFGAVKLFSSHYSEDKRVISVNHMPTKAAYSEFMMKELGRHIDTKNLLIFQYDGFVLNAEAWDKKWLQYDYIGAPWEWYDDGMKVGNGGFSLRSKYLQDAIMNDPHVVPINEPNVTRHKEEDHCICRIYRAYLEKRHNIKFAPVDEARKFSIEAWNTPNKIWDGQFGFHGQHADISRSGYANKA